MPTLRGTLDIFGDRPEQPCRWCGAPTATTLAPADRDPIPLHAVCGAEVIALYDDIRAGRAIPDGVALRLRALADPR